MDATFVNPPRDFRNSPEYETACRFLYGRLNFENFPRMPYSGRDLNLSRMQKLLALLGDPHLLIKVVHIAGTKGKGSTSAFLTAAVQAMGLRCGTYTSPHLHWVEERFCVNGQSCDPMRLVQLIDQVRPAVERMDRDNPANPGPTFFEIATAMAFLFFLEEQVDVAVMEVGLGGRLDSTNVCQPSVCIITSISYDHTKQLGNTLTSIATEKAGIIKPTVPVISGATAAEARATIEAVSRRQQVPLRQLGVDFRCERFRPANPQRPQALVDFQDRVEDQWETKAADVPLGLLGKHQAENAALAWDALRHLPQTQSYKADLLCEGFPQATCSARIEVVGHQPYTIVDAAHNVASVEALVSVTSALAVAGTRWLVLGGTQGKDITGMLEVLLPAFDRLICTQYKENPRGIDATELADLSRQIGMRVQAPCAATIQEATTPQEAWKRVRVASRQEDLVCVTGSFFIAAEMRTLALPTR